MVCPKCGAPIKRFDLAPNCKKCGVHIMYYTQEEDLARDAKKTELEFAKARMFTAKLKAAFISGKLAIARIVIMVVSLGVLCIPFSTFNISLDFFTEKISAGLIGAYNMYSSGIYARFFDFLKLGAAHGIAVNEFATLVIFILTVLITLVMFLTWILSFINVRRSAKALCGMSAAEIVLGAVYIGFVIALMGKTSATQMFSVSFGFGAPAVIAANIAMFTVNFLMIKSGIKPEIKEVDLKRAEISAKIKSGEINIDSLPLPIFETEEERLRREQAVGSSEKKKKESRKKKKNKDGEA